MVGRLGHGREARQRAALGVVGAARHGLESTRLWLADEPGRRAGTSEQVVANEATTGQRGGGEGQGGGGERKGKSKAVEEGDASGDYQLRRPRERKARWEGVELAAPGRQWLPGQLSDAQRLGCQCGRGVVRRRQRRMAATGCRTHVKEGERQPLGAQMIGWI
ncbi:hypothetical protein NL676_012001 [Syzygium grande]|nr:hypothetical protein NL676_012001 [Syzygium grande]